MELRWGAPEELLPINIPWGREFSGIPASWTQHPHPRGSGLTPSLGNKTLQATGLGKKGKKKEMKKEKRRVGRKQMKTNRQTKPKTNNKDKNKQTATATIKNKQMTNKTPD